MKAMIEATTGSLRAFNKAVQAKRMIYDACSELMNEDGRSTEDRERIGEFRSSIGRSISQFDEDGCDKVRREVEAEASAFLAGYGIEHNFSEWVYTSPPEPGAPVRACALNPPAAAPA